MVGSEPYAAVWDFANAVPKSRVEAHHLTGRAHLRAETASTVLPSGVLNRLNGITASLTAIGASAGRSPPSPPPAARPRPQVGDRLAQHHPGRCLGSGIAVAFETNGTVRDARGLASST